MQNNPVSILEAAKMLGRELFAQVPRNEDIIGTSLVAEPPNGLQLYVDVNIKAATMPKGIPTQYQGYSVRVRLVGQPELM